MLGKFIDRHREDSLTAAVFSHLLHLPLPLFWRILERSCHNGRFPKEPGGSVEASYWPCWDGADTSNVYNVRPDLFLRFRGLDLIIEAKRWDAEMHSESQWRDQLTAYENEYCQDDRHAEVRILAVGVPLGAPDRTVDSRSRKVTAADRRRITGCPVHMCRWSSILAECRRLHDDLHQVSEPVFDKAACQRVLVDLIDLFAWHQFQTGKWFSELVSTARTPLPTNEGGASFPNRLLK